MIKVGDSSNQDCQYLINRDKFTKNCISNGFIEENENDKLKFIKNFNGDKYNQLFKYNDEYGYERFYRINTCDPSFHQACCYKPYESLAFHCDENGDALCEECDPFNYAEVNNTGVKIDETHYATFFDLTYKSKYFWDPENVTDNNE